MAITPQRMAELQQYYNQKPDYNNPAVVQNAMNELYPEEPQPVTLSNEQPQGAISPQRAAELKQYYASQQQPVTPPPAQPETSMLEDFARGGGNVIADRGVAMIQLLDEASGGNILSPKYREASYQASNKLAKERGELGMTGKIASIAADPLMALPFASGLRGAKALAATGAVIGAAGGGLSSVQSPEENRLANTAMGGGVGAIAAPIIGKATSAILSPIQTAKNIGGYLGKALGVLPENLATFEAAKVQPNLGDVSSSNIIKRTQNILKDVPIAGSIIARGEDRLSQGIQKGLGKAGFDMSLERAVGGDAAKQGLTEYTRRGKEFFSKAYDNFDKKFIASNETVSISNTVSKISDILKRADTPEALDVYLGATEKGIIQKIQNAVESNPRAELSYNDTKLFRTSIGKKLEDYTIGSSEKGVLRELYGSLTADLRQKAAAKGKTSLEAFDRLNSNYSKFITKIDDTVNPIVNKGETTEIFNAIRSGVALPKQTATIMQSLPQKNRDILRGSLIREMGVDRTMAGQGEFNAARFAGKFKALDPKAQKSLLIGLPKEIQSDFMKVIDSAGLAAKTSLQGNASGSARSAFIGATAVGGITNTILTAKLIAGGTITAKMFTSPRFIKWLANAPKQNQGNLSQYIAKLSAIATADYANKDDIKNYQQELTGSDSGILEERKPLKVTISPQRGANP